MNATLQKPYYHLMMIMKQKGVTQKELAENINMDASMLSQKINGKRSMKLEEAKMIAFCLQIDLEDIE